MSGTFLNFFADEDGVNVVRLEADGSEELLGELKLDQVEELKAWLEGWLSEGEAQKKKPTQKERATSCGAARQKHSEPQIHRS